MTVDRTQHTTAYCILEYSCRRYQSYVIFGATVISPNIVGFLESRSDKMKTKCLETYLIVICSTETLARWAYVEGHLGNDTQKHRNSTYHRIRSQLHLALALMRGPCRHGGYAMVQASYRHEHRSHAGVKGWSTG
jgi:hypothetical protein